MLAEERRQKILSLLDEKETVYVSSLSKEFDVTEETIRRDLDILNEKKLLKRIHGGAVILENTKLELNFKIREYKNTKEKKEIAKKAAVLVRDSDTIFLDASSTSFFLAKELAKKQNISIITNSIRIIYHLVETGSNTIIATGGILRSNSLSLVGPLANETIKKYNADKIFASCKGISVEYGATDSNELEIEVKQNMIKQARELIIIADYSKFNKVGLTQFAPIEKINTIITDSNTSISQVNELKEKGISIL